MYYIVVLIGLIVEIRILCSMAHFTYRRGLVMSETPDGDVIHFHKLIRLLDFFVLFHWSTWLYIRDKTTVGRCAFTARDTQT